MAFVIVCSVLVVTLAFVDTGNWRLRDAEIQKLQNLANANVEVREYLQKFVAPGQAWTRHHLEKAESIVALLPLRQMLSGSDPSRGLDEEKGSGH